MSEQEAPGAVADVESMEVDIRTAYVSWHTEPSPDGSYIPMTDGEAQAEFDRWKAANDAQVLRDAANRIIAGARTPSHTRPQTQAISRLLARRLSALLKAEADRIEEGQG